MNDRVFADSSLADDIASPLPHRSSLSHNERPAASSSSPLHSSKHANGTTHNGNDTHREGPLGNAMRPVYPSPPRHPPFAATAPPDESDEDDLAAASHSRPSRSAAQVRRSEGQPYTSQQQQQQDAAAMRSHYKARVEEAAAGVHHFSPREIREDDPATVTAGGNDPASRGSSSSASSSTQTTPLVKPHRNEKNNSHTNTIPNTTVHSHEAHGAYNGRENSHTTSALALPQSNTSNDHHVDPNGSALPPQPQQAATLMSRDNARQHRPAGSVSTSYLTRARLQQAQDGEAAGPQQQQTIHSPHHYNVNDAGTPCVDDEDDERPSANDDAGYYNNMDDLNVDGDDEATQAMPARPPAVAALPIAALDKKAPVKPTPIDPFYYHVIAVVNPGSGTNATATFIYQVMLALLGSARVRLMKKADFADPTELRAMIRDYGVIYHPNGPRTAKNRSRLAQTTNSTTAASGKSRTRRSTERVTAAGSGSGTSNTNLHRSAEEARSTSNNTAGKVAPMAGSPTMTVSEEHEPSGRRPQRPRGTIFVAGGDGTISFILSQLDAVREELEAKYNHIGSRLRQARATTTTTAVMSSTGERQGRLLPPLPPREGSMTALRSPSNIYASPVDGRVAGCTANGDGSQHLFTSSPTGPNTQGEAREAQNTAEQHHQDAEEHESVSSEASSLQGSAFCYDSDVEKAHGLGLGDEYDGGSALLYTLPAVAPVPLGTGNDFSNCLGFGAGFVQGSCPRCCTCCKRCCAHCCGCCKEVATFVDILDTALESPCVPFDRWAADMIPLRVAQDYFDPDRLGLQVPSAAPSPLSPAPLTTSASTNIIIQSERSTEQSAFTTTTVPYNEMNGATQHGGESALYSDPSAQKALMQAHLARLHKTAPLRPPDMPVANLVNGVNWDAIRHDRQCITRPVMNYLSVGYDAYITCRFDKLRREHPNLCTTRLQNKALYGVCALIAAARCEALQKLLPMVVIPSPWPTASHSRTHNYHSTSQQHHSRVRRDDDEEGGGSVAKSEQQQPAEEHSALAGRTESTSAIAVPALQRTARQLHTELERPRHGIRHRNSEGNDNEEDGSMSGRIREMLGLQLPAESKVLLMTNISRYAAGTAPWEPISRAPRYTAIDLDPQHNQLVVNSDVVQENSVARPVMINDRHFEVQSMGGVGNYGTMRMGLSGANKITQTDEMFIFVLCTPDDLRFPRTAFSPYTKKHLRKYIYAMQDDPGLRASLNVQIDGEAMPRVAEPTIIHIRPYTTHRVRVRCRNMAVVKRTLIVDDLAFISRDV